MLCGHTECVYPHVLMIKLLMCPSSTSVSDMVLNVSSLATSSGLKGKSVSFWVGCISSACVLQVLIGLTA